MPLDPSGVYELRADPALESVLNSYAGLLDMISNQEPHKMVAAAMAYVGAAVLGFAGEMDIVEYQHIPAPAGWPYRASSWNPVNPRMDLVAAAALMIAEVKRMDDAAQGHSAGQTRTN